MRKILSAISIIVGPILAHSGFAADDIDVLVAVTPSAAAHGADPFTLASQLENQMEIALDATGSGLQNREMNFYAYPVPTTYLGDALAGSDVEAAYQSLLYGQDVSLAVARESLIPYSVPGFDLVVMVGWGFEVQSGPLAGALVCGWASDPVDYDNWLNRENQAWLILNTDNICLDDFDSWLIPHEFGHMLGSNHQISGGIGDDTAPSYPVPYNHPVLETFGFTSVATPVGIDLAYFKQQYSNPDLGNLPGTAYPAGSSVEDNAKLFTEDTWDMVAAYRPLPSPTIDECPVQYVTCNGNTMMTAITPSLNEPYAVTSIDYDYGTSVNGPWTDYYSGPSSCVFRGGSYTFWARLIVNTIYGSATCIERVYINPWNACEEEGW